MGHTHAKKKKKKKRNKHEGAAWRLSRGNKTIWHMSVAEHSLYAQGLMGHESWETHDRKTRDEPGAQNKTESDEELQNLNRQTRTPWEPNWSYE